MDFDLVKTSTLSYSQIDSDDNDNDQISDSDGDSITRQFQQQQSRKLRKLSFRKRKCRTTFSKLQLSILESEFLSSNFVSNDRLDSLIATTGLDAQIIKNWFKNKRSRVLLNAMVTNKLNNKSPNQRKYENISNTEYTPSEISLNSDECASQYIDIEAHYEDIREEIEQKEQEIIKPQTPHSHFQSFCELCLCSTCNCSLNVSRIAIEKLYIHYRGFNDDYNEDYLIHSDNLFKQPTLVKDYENNKIFEIL